MKRDTAVGIAIVLLAAVALVGVLGLKWPASPPPTFRILREISVKLAPCFVIQESGNDGKWQVVCPPSVYQRTRLPAEMPPTAGGKKP